MCNDDPSFHKGLGRLYNWDADNKACPDNWHLPSEIEWETLINYFGGIYEAAKKLKSSKGWYNNGNGTNESGFNALPGGKCHIFTNKKEFIHIGVHSVWWTSEECLPPKCDIEGALEIKLLDDENLVFYRYSFKGTSKNLLLI
ncbi:FISUMP domain-containing protein [Bacteroidota bacterium]